MINSILFEVCYSIPYFASGYIEETTGRRLKVEPGQGGNDENVIMLGLDASIDNPEGYELTVLPDRVTIKVNG